MGEKTQYSSYRWAMLVSACLAIISICVDMIAISPVLGEVAKDLNVEMGVATNLMMGVCVGNGVCAHLGRCGRR